MKHILLAGSFGQGNTGDDAILAAMIAGLRERLPSTRLQAVAGKEGPLRARYGVETVSWADWAAIIEVVKGTDLVILGGGGIFFDYRGFDPGSLLVNGASDLAHYASFPLLAALYEKPLMLYGVGLGPLISEEARAIVRLAFDLATVATVRDADAAARAAALGVEMSRIEVTTDPAFALEVIDETEARELIRASGCDPERPVFAIAPKPWPAYKPYDLASDWVPALGEALRPIDAQLLLIPFQPGEDDEVIDRCGELRDGWQIHRLVPGLAPAQIAGVIGACDLIFGIRLHAMIFAALTGTPGVALTNEPKVRSLMAQIGREQFCVEASEPDALAPAIERAWARRDELRREGREAAAGWRRSALRNVELAAGLIAQPVDARREPRGLLPSLARLIEARLKEERAQEYALGKLLGV